MRIRLNELEQRLRERREAQRLLADFCKRQGDVDIDELKLCITSWKRVLPRFG
ncbi:hypothetical protein ACLK17_05795 [Escherichia coli]